MAYSATGLRRFTHQNAGGNAWTYKTADTIATVTGANYFDSAAAVLAVNDLLVLSADNVVGFAHVTVNTGSAVTIVASSGASVAAGDITDATAIGESVLTAADAAAVRTLLALVVGTNVQAFDAELASLAGLTSAADRLPYFTGSGTASLANFAAAARSLLALTAAADRLPYFDGSSTAALATFTTAGRNLIDDADNTAQRTTLGLGSIATQAASAVTITGGSVTGITDITVADGGTGASTATLARAAINQGVVALTDIATIATDCSLGNVFSVTLGGNRALGAPTNGVAGATYAWIITQDGSGGRGLTLDAVFKQQAGVEAWAPSADIGAVDLITAVCLSSTSFLIGWGKGYA